MTDTQSAVILRPNSPPEPLADASLESVQSVVGGYVEALQLGNRKVLLVNEEGALKGLPYNPDASALFGRRIVGNAVLVENSTEW